MVASLQSPTETQLGKKFTKFEVVQYRIQVVAGTMYHVKIMVNEEDDNNNDDDDDEYAIHMKFFEALPFEKKPLKIIKIMEQVPKDDELKLL